MKKNILIITLVIALGVITGCQKSDNSIKVEGSIEENTNPEGMEQDNPLETAPSGLLDIINQIYEIKSPELALGDITVDITDADSVKYYTGITDISKVKDVAVSEAMIGSQAYSLVLVKLNQAEDAETIAAEMLNGIDPRKWICVEADDMQVVAHDDLIMLFMVSSELKDTVTSQEIVDAFKEVCGGELNLQLKK